uniref:B cell linker n=2 Tax=Strigidae TaxID=30459 RepID=A0A663M9Y1_ATHCN
MKLQKMVHDIKKNESGIINKFKNPPVFQSHKTKPTITEHPYSSKKH